MKTTIWLLFFILLTLPACAQTNIEHEWKATIRVVDEAGAPMSGIHATIGYYTNSVSTGTDGITDTNGIFTLSKKAQSEYADISFEAKKSGYYSIWQEVNLQSPFDAEKWIIVKPLVLKKIVKPTAMYAKSLNLGLPVFDKPAGFDFTIGDWVGPYGKGVSADIIFTGHLNQRTEFDADYKLTVSFQKVGDGIQEFIVPEVEKGSGLRSPQNAPTNSYQLQWVQTRNRKPGQPETGNFDLNGHRNYFFRVRTMLDHNGNVMSAHYGKIYGDFMQFSYYLNPTPNDRNIEFDPKQNLIQGLDALEQVTAP